MMDQTEAQERQRVIAEAWKYVGTPWRHMGDTLGAGIDCAMSLVRWFVDSGIVAPFDPRPYPRSWFLHQDRELFLEWIIEKFNGVEVEHPKPGDILVYKYGRCFSHGTLMVAPQMVVHAFYKNGTCLATETFDAELKKRSMRAFDMWAGR